MPRYVIVLVIVGVLVFGAVVGHMHHSTPAVPQKAPYVCVITAYNACIGLPNTGGSYVYPTNDVPKVPS